MHVVYLADHYMAEIFVNGGVLSATGANPNVYIPEYTVTLL